MKQTFFSIAILLVLIVPAALGQEPIDTQPAPELEAATADPADIIDIEPSLDLIEAEEPQFEPKRVMLPMSSLCPCAKPHAHAAKLFIGESNPELKLL